MANNQKTGKLKLKYGNRNVNVGDIVNYVATGTDYDGYWRIIGVSGEGQLLLASDKNVGALKLEGKKHYETGVDFLHIFCKQFGHGIGAVTARCTTLEDRLKLGYLRENAPWLIDFSGYWLATQHVFKINAETVFYGMHFLNNDYTDSEWLYLKLNDKVTRDLSTGYKGVRPVVVLEKGIKLQRVGTAEGNSVYSIINK